MADNEFEKEPKAGDVERLKDSTSETAIKAAQGAVDQAPDVKRRVKEAAARARRNARQSSESAGARPHSTSAAEGTMDVARSGYRAASEQVVASPMAALTIATLLGVAVGWMLRGLGEEERRQEIDSLLPAYVRRRIGR